MRLLVAQPQICLRFEIFFSGRTFYDHKICCWSASCPSNRTSVCRAAKGEQTSRRCLKQLQQNAGIAGRRSSLAYATIPALRAGTAWNYLDFVYYRTFRRKSSSMIYIDNFYSRLAGHCGAGLFQLWTDLSNDGAVVLSLELLRHYQHFDANLQPNLYNLTRQLSGTDRVIASPLVKLITWCVFLIMNI